MMCVRSVVAALFAAFLFLGCSYPENVGTLPGENEDEKDELSGLVSIAFIKSHYKGYPYTFKESYSIKGYVISSDRYGNYSRTLVIMDDTGAIEIKLDMYDLFLKYPVCTQVEVLCNTLTIGASGDVLQLGGDPASNYEISYIDEERVDNIIKKIGLSETEILPEEKIINALTPGDISRFVVLRDVQFEEPLLLWCDEDPEDKSGLKDTNRYVVDREGNRIAVRTSRYAEFGGWQLPVGSGDLTGILSSFGGEFQVVVTVPGVIYMSMDGARF